MTNNEAIEIIKLALAQIEWDYPMDYAVAFDLAIKALEQEPFKPMVEIDLYSVIKQKYIEREVIDKIRAEIRANSIYVMPQYGRTIREADVLHIIDKYKAESEKV